MIKARDRAVEGRNDLSRFVVHLTRDDTGQTARERFEAIVRERNIRAWRPHCLHMDRIPRDHWHRYAVCCFMEVPLSELHLMTRPIAGRRICYGDYGFVFSREFLVSKAAQPAMYVNSYGGNGLVREAADRVFDLAKEEGFADGTVGRLLPYLNAMHEGYDFAWEREWRVLGDLPFGFEDLVCVILPEEGEDGLQEELLENGVPAVSPGWTAERIVAELSGQARRARRLGSGITPPRSGGSRPPLRTGAVRGNWGPLRDRGGAGGSD